MRYNEGRIQFSTSVISVEVYFLPFHLCDEESAHILYYRLSLVSRPYIMRPLAYSRGFGRYNRYTILAVPPFIYTLSQYVVGEVFGLLISSGLLKNSLK